MKGKNYLKPSIRISFDDLDDVLSQSVEWNTDWDTILDGDEFYRGE